MDICNVEFDNQFKSIKNLKWKPWVGKNYNSTLKHKLLIVGESHYCWKNKLESSEKIKAQINSYGFTRSVIHQSGTCKSIKNKQPIFRNIEKVIFNTKKLRDTKRINFWQSLSFYNFIQRPLLSRENKHRPNNNDWSEGWVTFFEVIDVLNPDMILFCGVEALNQNLILHETFGKGNYRYIKKIVKTKSKIGNTFIRTNGIFENSLKKNVSIYCIDHPSSFFSWTKWHQVLTKYENEYLKWINDLI